MSNSANHKSNKIKVIVKPIKKTYECPEYEIFRKCRENKIIIRGNVETLRKILDYRINGFYARDDSYYARKLLDNFLYRLGKTHSKFLPVNNFDCITSCHVTAIPKSHYFEVLEGNCVYVYDVRTLNSEELWFNHFTHTPLNESNTSRLLRKIRWMEKYGYPTKFNNIESNDHNLSIKQLTTNVINHINRYNYIDRKWFDELNLNQLKKLYMCLYDLWTYRLGLDNQEKINLMPPDGLLCPNVNTIKKYTDNMSIKLRRELLLIIERLAQNKNSAIYFMLALVYVSDDAAKCYPDLYKVWG